MLKKMTLEGKSKHCELRASEAFQLTYIENHLEDLKQRYIQVQIENENEVISKLTSITD